ncbi:MAG TPA: hypothetical protein VKT71_04030 [Candidatus Acidoferrales bacterium]|nr:hypothetical protein [Candidatus Acidoferrales bacterium]
MSSHQFAYAQKRRSTRIAQAIPLVVQGVGAMREPYHEEVSTLSISCHGCTYQSRHEVIQGETVFLDIKQPANGSAGCSSKAQVKWAQKSGAGKDRVFQIAVELEIAGNVWGVPTPPPDWFPVQLPDVTEAVATSRELKVVTRKEQQTMAAASSGTSLAATSERSEASKAAVAPLAQLMVGLGEQIQNMASEAAAAALVKEKSRLLDEFRAQLREEAVRTIQSAIAASKEVIVRQAMKELSDAHEAGARSNYAHWMKKVQQDMESARLHVIDQGKEMSQRLDTLAASTIERVQRNMETSRSEAVDRFVARLRDQVVPMLAEAKDSLQKLQGAEIGLRKESEAIFAGLESQLAYSTNVILAKSQEDLEKNGAAITARASEALLKLSQDFETRARESASLLLTATGNQAAKSLQERSTQASNEFSAGIAEYTRTYLESISKSIAEIPRNIPQRQS